MPVAAYEELSDTALAALARDGGMEALGAIYARHAEMLHRVAFRLLASADEAEDLVQDLFVGLPEALRRYEERGRLDAWLRTIATRAALMRLRASRRLVEAACEESSSDAPEDLLAARLALEGALVRLSAPLRVVFVLKEVEGYSHTEIAGMLGIKVGTSEVRLYRATRALRAMLRRS
jgi:RNA polymerase sigma-70 factor (ECF subfamily)